MHPSYPHYQPGVSQAPGEPHIQSSQPPAAAGPGMPSQAPGMFEQAPHLYHPYTPQAYAYDGQVAAGQPMGAPGAIPPVAPDSGIGSWFQFSNSGYLKGFLLGAGVTLLLTNPTVQKTLVRGTVKLWSLAQGGVEEVKEQFRDIKAEMSQEKE